MRLLCALSALCLMLSGCGSVETTADTGARRCVLSFCAALVQGDLSAAYDLLHLDSRERVSKQQFVSIARAYLGAMEFRPDSVGLRACEEKENEATGHVVFTGRADGKSRRYRDAFTAKKTNEVWSVVLPSTWGM